MELTREAAWAQEVAFSRTDVLQRLGIAKNKNAYAQLSDGFTRLQNVSIRAKHAFYSPKTKADDVLRLFSLLDRVSIVGRAHGPCAEAPAAVALQWSDDVHQSMLAGTCARWI
jgi:hypothetical protein